jgi:hypothetical protein
MGDGQKEAAPPRWRLAASPRRRGTPAFRPLGINTVNNSIADLRLMYLLFRPEHDPADVEKLCL